MKAKTRSKTGVTTNNCQRDRRGKISVIIQVSWWHVQYTIRGFKHADVRVRGDKEDHHSSQVLNMTHKKVTEIVIHLKVDDEQQQQEQQQQLEGCTKKKEAGGRRTRLIDLSKYCTAPPNAP